MPQTPPSPARNTTTIHLPPVWSEPQWHAVGARLGTSERELEIVRGVLHDRKQSAIASQLGISTHTVHTHLVRLYLKLGVRSRMELAMRVMAEHAASLQ
jgi:DNA-binding NarL/FixJ family response regulator